MSGDEFKDDVEQYLRSHGWVMVRRRGDHRVWCSPSGKSEVPLPARSWIAPEVTAQLRRHTPPRSSRKRSFTAQAEFVGNWWIVRIPELDAVSQAKNIRELDFVATGLACAALDLPENKVRVAVTRLLPGNAEADWAEGDRLDAQAVKDRQQARMLHERAIQTLADAGLSHTDIAAALGISYQMVTKYAKKEDR